MSKKREYKVETILAAIENSGGIMSTIAKRLGCEWHTAEKYVLKYEKTRKALEDEENKVLDICQQTLIKSIKEGSTQDAKWYLSTKGKKRGFTERQEIVGHDGGPLTTKVEVVLVDSENGNK